MFCNLKRGECELLVELNDGLVVCLNNDCEEYDKR